MITSTTTKNPRYERWRWQIFGITWICYASFYFTRKAFSVAKIGVVDDPSVNEVLTKATMANFDAIYLIAYAIGQFSWGILADRLGPRVVVLGGLALSIIAAVIMGAAATLPIFATMMLAQGLGQSTGWSSLLKNLSHFFSTHERVVFLVFGVPVMPSVVFSGLRLLDSGHIRFSKVGELHFSLLRLWLQLISLHFFSFSETHQKMLGCQVSKHIMVNLLQ